MDEDYIYNIISEYDEDYQKEIGMNKLDDEDIRNIIFNILDNKEVNRIIHEEIEEYCNFKNN